MKLVETVTYRVVTYKLRATDPDYDTSKSVSSDGAIRIADELGEWTFVYSRLDAGAHGLGVQFKNRTSDVIEIHWDRSVLVDPAGRALRVVHRGVRMMDRNASIPPSIVPPDAILDDFVFPSEHIHYVSGRYGGWVNIGFFELVEPGQQMTLTLGLKVKNGLTSKTFRFAASAD